MNSEDKSIISLFFSRSERAITAVSDKYGLYCGKIAMNILQNEADKEETLNDTWLKAWNTIPPQNPNPLKTYLGMLTRTIAINRYSYYKAQKRNGSFDVLLSELEEVIPSSRAEQEFETGEIQKSINEFLKKTDKASRIIFVRRYYYADSIADIAKFFGFSESKVKSSLFRTRTKLRDFLEKEGIEI